MNPGAWTELRALAPAYALGALDPGEASRFEQTLSNSPELQREVSQYRDIVALLGVGQPSASPPKNLKARLMERIRPAGHAAETLSNAFPRLLGKEGPGELDLDALEWRAPERGSGFQIHWLRNDQDTGEMAVLLRGSPGATYPDHRHCGGEQFFVLHGSFEDHRAQYSAGDFYAFAPGSEHRDLRVTGDEPCVLLVLTGPGGISPLERE